MKNPEKRGSTAKAERDAKDANLRARTNQTGDKGRVSPPRRPESRKERET